MVPRASAALPLAPCVTLRTVSCLPDWRHLCLQQGSRTSNPCATQKNFLCRHQKREDSLFKDLAVKRSIEWFQRLSTNSLEIENRKR